MNQYYKTMEGFSPDALPATGPMMQEVPIAVVDDIPRQTSSIEEKILNQEEAPPRYMAPNEIVVERFILKK